MFELIPVAAYLPSASVICIDLDIVISEVASKGCSFFASFVHISNDHDFIFFHDLDREVFIEV